MTKRNRFLWLVACLGLLLLGYLMFLITNSPENTMESAPFRLWFWENRFLDIYGQVGLLFAGALGVAIILSSHKEDLP